MRLQSKKRPDICETCRARKVSCDGLRPVCGNCERLGFRCTGYEQQEQATGHSSTHERRRARQACTNCHNLKAKCSGQRPQCNRCLAKGLECLYRMDRSSKSKCTNAASVAASNDSPFTSSRRRGSSHFAQDSDAMTVVSNLSQNLSTAAHDL